MNRFLRRIFVVIPALAMLLSLAGTAEANSCTVTKVGFDSRLFVTCGGVDMVGFRVTDSCVPQTADTLRLFYAIFQTALHSGKLVNVSFDPNCANGISEVQIFK